MRGPNAGSAHRGNSKAAAVTTKKRATEESYIYKRGEARVCVGIGAREAQISRFKASFAYCASRRRVFGRAITVACHFPLGYFFLSSSSLLFGPFAHFSSRLALLVHASRRNVDFSERDARESERFAGRAGRSSSITHVGSFCFHGDPCTLLGHSRDFHSSGADDTSRISDLRSWISVSFKNTSIRLFFSFNC